MLDYAADLEITVRDASARLRSASDQDAARHPAPGKWSAKEIIGHLIDSASNNHQRFVRANWQDELVFAGYDQEKWVAIQQYNAAPWNELVDLWLAFNLQLARIMETTPEATRTRLRSRHNLDELAFQPVAHEATVTLDFFMHDYVVHLHHHLRQLDGLCLYELT
ncbi:MAG: DinB family protein [Gemmatimonadaceae bacterium]